MTPRETRDALGPRCRPIEAWPAADQAAWRATLADHDPFGDAPYVRTRNAESLKKFSKGYGRWLDFLDARGELDPAEAPLTRVTRPRLRRYFQTLCRAGNADWTIVGRFAELASALAILAPGEDVSWIRRPDGASIYSLVEKSTRTFVVPDSQVLWDWALALMEGAADLRGLDRLLAYRDGLILAILAARARRLRTMALPTVGRELIREGDRYRMEFEISQTKTKRADRFDLPEELTPFIERYLDEIRPALLNGQHHDALWISSRHAPLSQKGFQMMVFRRTGKRFDVSFGPHRFRHALATTVALADPACPGLAAALLGGSTAVVEKHYNRAGQVQAAMKYAALYGD